MNSPTLLIMPRGRYPKRLYSIDIDQETLRRYKLDWQNKELYSHPEKFAPVTVKELFGVDKKFAIEIGCGDGQFLCTLAKRERNICFLGIEAIGKLSDIAVSNAAKDSLPNIRFLRADLRLIAPLFLSETVNDFYLHFPAPFSSKRELNRQTYSKEILLHVHRALVVGGRLSFITDDKPAFDFVSKEAREIEGFHRVDEKDYQLVLEDDLKSTYHKYWERKGRAIYRTEFEKG